MPTRLNILYVNIGTFCEVAQAVQKLVKHVSALCSVTSNTTQSIVSYCEQAIRGGDGHFTIVWLCIDSILIIDKYTIPCSFQSVFQCPKGPRPPTNLLHELRVLLPRGLSGGVRYTS